jgi:hypothetical protein
MIRNISAMEKGRDLKVFLSERSWLSEKARLERYFIRSVDHARKNDMESDRDLDFFFIEAR